MPNKCPTESGKSQTAVLGKRVAHPSFGDRVWTSLYILFKYPIYRPVLTRVREYDSIRFSMATVLVFPSLQYGFLGEALPTAHSSGAGGCPRPRLHFEAPTDSECSGFRIEGSPVEARVASREFMPLARSHSMVRHAAEGILFPLAIFPANRKTIAVRWKQPCPF